MRRISILGSTGSIGRNALDVVQRHSDRFEVVGLAAGSNAALLAEQVRRFKPRWVALRDKRGLKELRRDVGHTKIRFRGGDEGIESIATLEAADLVVSAISGSAGLAPTLAAARAGKTVVLANKESVVMAGDLLMRLARKAKARIIPVDSEHNAIFQCIDRLPKRHVAKLTITASGGPFLRTPIEDLPRVTPQMALNHPIWRMGKKITIDSATLMNKALEMIEARWLFDVSPDKIGVLVHPQSIVHAVVECVDTAVFALMALPDMRVPLAHAMSYPDRVPIDLPRLDLARVNSLEFLTPDENRFPSLGIAREVLHSSDGSQIVMNAANEVAAYAFLDGHIPFTGIPRTVASTLGSYTGRRVDSVEDVFEIDRWAKDRAARICAPHRRGVASLAGGM